MNLCDFQKIVIEQLKSCSLKSAIKKQGKQFSDIELCKIIYEYVEKYDDRLSLLKELQTVSKDKEMFMYLEVVIREMEEHLKAFPEPKPGFVYELHIKETPDAYEERYLCNSYQSALDMIDEYYKEYEESANDSARYKIVKRKIIDSKMDKFDEDFYGSCTLNFMKEICSVTYREEQDNIYGCDGMCYECNRLCMFNTNIGFPFFVGFKELVKYTDRTGKIKFGVNLDEYSESAEDAYIIPLDCYALKYRYFEKAFDYHKHIPLPFVETANIDDLNEDLRGIYNDYIGYMDKSLNG